MINSIEAMEDVDGRELTLRSQRDGSDYLVIWLRGAGVALAAHRDEIFNAFFTTKANGTGTGLAISRSIIDPHGGRLWATLNSSRRPTFHCSLPKSSEARQ